MAIVFLSDLKVPSCAVSASSWRLVQGPRPTASMLTPASGSPAINRGCQSGGYKEMSSILADQRVQMRGEGGTCGISANQYSCAHHVTWSPNELWRFTSIFNLCNPGSIHQRQQHLSRLHWNGGVMVGTTARLGYWKGGLECSVADPDPNPDTDPPDPHVFGLPGSGSGSVSQRYGSGSFYH